MTKSKEKVISIEEAIEKVDCEAIINLAAKHRNKKDGYSFCDYMKNKSESEIAEITENLNKILQDYIAEHLIQNGTINWASSNPESCRMVGQLIQAMTEIALASIQCNFVLRSHLRLAVLLNGIMLPMPSTLESTRNVISQYCEKLYLTEVFKDGCEYFLYNVVIYLLRKSLGEKALKEISRNKVCRRKQEKVLPQGLSLGRNYSKLVEASQSDWSTETGDVAKKVDVKRLHAIRKIIKVVAEMKEVSKTELWRLFKRCALSQTYLSITEGQKLISLSMTLDDEKVPEMHKLIKDSLEFMTIKTAIAYGVIYYDAWFYSIKTQNERLKDVIELTCIQDFILIGLTAQQKPTLPLVRKILSKFSGKKKDLRNCELLYTLYQPLIWRYLKSPNGQIRANATQLFLDIFPLEDPNERLVGTDAEVNQQLIMIKELLTDDFPIVRITTILGICLSMSVNWEVFPEEMLKSFFRIIINDLSRDSSSAEVRISVVRGLKCLLENPLSLKCLVGVLPRLTGLFHDVDENVRIAFCQLLLRVKTISAIKYFEIVPTHHLFARLEVDCHAVQKAITNLMINSYFPLKEDPKVWLGRCLEIMRTERLAARVFFSYASCFIGLEASVRFIIQSVKAVHFYVKTKNSSEKLDKETSNKENVANLDDYIVSLEEAVGFSNLNVVSTVMDAISTMWMSLKFDYEEAVSKHYLKMLVHRIGPALSELCIYYKETVAWESVFYVSSFLPPTMVPSLGSCLFWRLKNLPPDADRTIYWTLTESLINQLQAFELLNLLKEWIEAGLADSYVPPSTKKRRKTRKGGESIYFDQPKPYLANRILDSLLNHRGSQKSCLNHPGVLKEMLCFVDFIKRKLERFNAKVMNKVDAEFLSLLMLNILRISVFVHNPHANDEPFVNGVLTWFEKTLLKHLDVSDYTTNTFTELVFKICESICAVVSDVAGLGYCDKTTTLHLEFFEKIFCIGLASEFFEIASKFLFKHAAGGQYFYLMESDYAMIQCLLNHLPKFFNCLHNEKLLLSISKERLDILVHGFASVMHIENNYIQKLPEQVSKVFKCLLQHILDSTVIKTSEIVEEMAEDPFDRLSFPKVGAFFMQVATYKVKVAPSYVTFLIEMFNSSEINISLWIAYWMMTYEFLTKNTSPSVFSEIEAIICILDTYLHQIYPRENHTDSMNTSIAENADSVPMQLFQRHCHGELIKLKKRQETKMKAYRVQAHRVQLLQK